MSKAIRVPDTRKEKLKKYFVGKINFRTFTVLVQFYVLLNFPYSKYASLHGCHSFIGLDKPSANGVFCFNDPFKLSHYGK